MVQLNRLEGFWYVAKEGGYARAARGFPYPITQPAVHQQVKKLEQEVGARLFERVGKDRMILTPAGEHLFALVDPFLSALPAVARSLREGEFGGTLKIAAASMLLRRLFPRWLARFRARHPGVQVELIEALSPDLDGLRKGRVDLLVDYLPEVPDEICVREVGRLYPFVIIPASWKLAQRKRWALRDCAGEAFVSYSPGKVGHGLQMRVLDLHDVKPERTISVTSAETIMGFVASGLGFSLVASVDPEGPVDPGLCARPVKRPSVPLPVVAAWRPGPPTNPLIEAFVGASPKPAKSKSR